jgi:transglutaminase-like putative cysteine protease
MSGRDCWLVRHRLAYRFALPREGCTLRLRLRPRDRPGQRLLRATIACGGQAPAAPGTDRWGNWLDDIALPGPLDTVTIEAESLVALSPAGADRTPPAPADREAPAEVAAIPGFRAWSARYLPEASPGAADIARLAAGIRRDFAYDMAATAFGTPLAEVFAACRGTCQDFARLAVAALQARGCPARYRLGYPLPGAAGGEVALHAWFAAWLGEELGWAEADPVLPGATRLLLAEAPRQEEVPVVEGQCAGPPCAQTLRHAVTIRPALHARLTPAPAPAAAGPAR